MLKLILLSFVFWCAISSVFSDSMIGPGKWKMLKMEKKEGQFDKFEFDIVQRKYNRTHDVFQGVIKFLEELNNLFGARIDICKFVDGGCKQYLVVSDDKFGGMIEKYCHENFMEMMRGSGVEEPKFPIDKGEYEVKNYMWNWDSLPEEGPFGHYIADCCVLEGTAEVGCLKVELEFVENDDEEDSDE